MAEREAVTAEALGELYAKFRISLTATARRALLARGVPESVVSAEDIVQNAFAKAMRDPASIERPIGYLRTVIRTEVANRARQEADHSRTDLRRAADPLRFDPVQSADFAALVSVHRASRRVVTIEDLGLVRHGRVGRHRGDGSVEHPDGMPWAPERTAAVLTEFTGMDLMLNRRGLVGAGTALAAGSTLTGAMHDRIHTAPGRLPQPEDRYAESPHKLDTPAHHATREALKILEVVTYAPHGAVSRAQIARSLKTFGRAEAAALSMLLNQGYLQQLPDSRYTAGLDLADLIDPAGTSRETNTISQEINTLATHANGPGREVRGRMQRPPGARNPS